MFCPGFCKDIADMIIDGAFANRKLLCDFLIGLASGHKFNDFQFSFRKVCPAQLEPRRCGLLTGVALSHGDLSRGVNPKEGSWGMMSGIRPVAVKLAQALSSEQFTITAEVAPPRGGDVTRTLEAASALKGLVHAVNVTDGSRAVMGMSSLAVCRLLMERGIEPVLQMTCRDRNRIALQADLLGAHALGIPNVLCLTGDPVRAGDQPDARPVNELESVRLLKLVASLNAGTDPVKGLLPDGRIQLLSGAAADPHSPSWSGLASRVRKKWEAGARFMQTQMVMHADPLRRFVEEITGPLGLPVLAGVFLLKSAKNAQFINRVVPGASIPQSLIDRLAAAEDPATEGIVIAAEQVATYAEIAQGVHLMAIKAEERIPRILAMAGVKPLEGGQI
jgi:methylenetetrahydrofolate reductase (NADPH)